ncbi:hypothetical protein FACS1894182_14860 [Bacteroidia bacterium]|nr:hypothetical protein FACS1894182_14860 [Bacteroidia bacterium]
MNLSKTGFGSGIEDIDILEALLHECFMHIQTYVNAKGINYSNLYNAVQDKKYEPDNHHYHFTQIISTYKGKSFKDLPTDETLYEKNGNKIIGLKYWPIKAFDILKEYTNGRVSDYKLQHYMMIFDGSQISISETTGKIEDKK